MKISGSSRVVASLVAALLAMGCSASGERRAGEGSGYDGNRITAEELSSAGIDAGASSFQIIQRLRPAWLRGRGATTVRGSEPPIPVYVNGQRVSDGGALALGRYTAREIKELSFLNSMLATQRFGTGHPSGAILISLR